MPTSQTQNWIRDVGPPSGTSHSFEDIPLTPLPDNAQSAKNRKGFLHAPLEHETIGSGSAWDLSVAASDEVNDQQSVISMGHSEQGSPSGTSECSLSAGGDQAGRFADVSDGEELEALSRTPGVFNARSESASAPDSGTLRTASTVTLVGSLVALDTISEATVTANRTSPPTESGHIDSPAVSERDIGDERIRDEAITFPEPSNRSRRPAIVSLPTPLATALTHTTFPPPDSPATLPTSSSSPGSFDPPIPIFPFPPGTSRCTDRTCPIKHRHERGPYLHDGKLRTRQGSVFGASNPPPEIWALYDGLREGGGRGVGGMGGRAGEALGGFVRVHYGETEGEAGGGEGEGERRREGKEEKGKKEEGKKSWFRRYLG